MCTSCDLTFPPVFLTPLVVLPHLHKLALGNNSQAVESKRIDIATQLFEAYSALSCCCILPCVMLSGQGKLGHTLVSLDLPY